MENNQTPEEQIKTLFASLHYTKQFEVKEWMENYLAKDASNRIHEKSKEVSEKTNSFLAKAADLFKLSKDK